MTPEEFYYQIHPGDPLNPEITKKPFKISLIIKYVVISGFFFLLGYGYHLITFGRGYLP